MHIRAILALKSVNLTPVCETTVLTQASPCLLQHRYAYIESATACISCQDFPSSCGTLNPSGNVPRLAQASATVLRTPATSQKKWHVACSFRSFWATLDAPIMTQQGKGALVSAHVEPLSKSEDHPLEYHWGMERKVRGLQNGWGIP